MPTDHAKLPLDDLLDALFYAARHCEWDECKSIRAEIARRIEVRDRLAKHMLGQVPTGRCTVWWSGDEQVARAELLEQSDSVYYEHNGEQIL